MRGMRRRALRACPAVLMLTPQIRQVAEGAMHDIVISGGTIVDGTGAPTFTSDVAGMSIFEHGQDTGARPGRLVRNGW
jgi:N-acyl-D-aspartate/D-glutamate deacylase